MMGYYYLEDLMRIAAIILVVVTVIMAAVSCGGGSAKPTPTPEPPPSQKATATVIWSAVDAREWTIEAWQPGGTPETDVILWTGELMGPGQLEHEFTVDTWERIRFRYYSGDRIGADQHDLMGPGEYSFTLSPRFVK